MSTIKVVDSSSPNKVTVQQGNSNAIKVVESSDIRVIKLRTGPAGPAGADSTVVGPTGPTGAIDVTSSIISVGGISSSGGATFGGDIILPDDSFVGVSGDERIVFDSNGNVITLVTGKVVISRKLQRINDEDTFIDFTDDNIELQAGDSDGSIHMVAGLSADMGATFGSGILVQGGVTCDSIAYPDGNSQSSTQTDIIGINVDNGSQVLTTGIKGHRVLPYDCEIAEWNISSSVSGDITWDVNEQVFSLFGAVAADSVNKDSGSQIPTMSGAYTSTQSSPSWGKNTFNAGDVLEFEIDSVAFLTNCNLSIKIKRTS